MPAPPTLSSRQDWKADEEISHMWIPSLLHVKHDTSSAATNLYLCMYTKIMYTCMCIYTYMYMHTHTYMYSRYACVCVCKFATFVDSFRCAFTFISSHKYNHLLIHFYSCMCSSVLVFSCMSICVATDLFAHLLSCSFVHSCSLCGCI